MNVTLRKATPDDIPALKSAYALSRHLHEPFTYPPEDFTAHVAQPHLYLIVSKPDQILVGSINISNIVMGYFCSAYLGYQIFSPHNNKGYMGEALRLILGVAFNDLNLHRLEANIQPDNKASIALVKRAGFILEGYSKSYLRIGGKQWQDHERWAIVNSQWQPAL